MWREKLKQIDCAHTFNLGEIEDCVALQSLFLLLPIAILFSVNLVDNRQQLVRWIWCGTSSKKKKKIYKPILSACNCNNTRLWRRRNFIGYGLHVICKRECHSRVFASEAFDYLLDDMKEFIRCDEVRASSLYNSSEWFDWIFTHIFCWFLWLIRKLINLKDLSLTSSNSVALPPCFIPTKWNEIDFSFTLS